MAYLSIIVPVYKAEDCLHELYKRLVASIKRITNDFEILLIEDDGGDSSWKIISELSHMDTRVKGIKLSKNYGQHYAITAGLDNCNGDWVVVMDCDLQDRPEDIPALYDRAQEGYEIVFASRNNRQDSMLRRIQSKLYNKVFCYMTDIQVDANVANFSIISRKVVLNLSSIQEQLRYYCGLLNIVGFSRTTITVEHANRFAGNSSYTFNKLIQLASNTIIAHSTKPLKMVIKLGLFMSFFSFSYGFYILIRAFFLKTAIIGWSSLIVSLYFLGGLIIGTLGIIGIYLGKTFEESKKRPLYFIAEKTN